MTKTVILNSDQIHQKIHRIAYQIYENNYDETEIVIAGIASNGYILAERIANVLKEISPIKVLLIDVILDKKNPLSADINIKLSNEQLTNKVIILVDDVLNSGKTLIFGAKPFLNCPIKRLTTVVLVDRGHNRYPIKADLIGLSLSTTLQEHITVEMNTKGNAKAYLS